MQFAVRALLSLSWILPALAQEDSGNGPRRAPPRWTEIDAVPQGWLTDVFFLDEKTGWLLTSEGSLASTSDGGRTWDSVRGPTQGDYCTGVWFLDAKRGFVISGLRGCDWYVPAKLVATEDGGRTWKDRTPELPDVSRGIFDGIQFVSPTEGFIFGRQLLATRDAGKTWSAAGPEWLVVSRSNSCFTSPKSGWVLYDDNLWRSEDGGMTWQPTGAANALSDDELVHTRLQHPCFQTEQFGWVLTGWGKILRTEDGGLSWKSLDGFRNGRVRQLIVADPGHAWVLVEHDERGSQILRTTDGGRSWKESIRTPRRLQRMFFLRPELGWAVGDGAILRISADR
jgi:photosystem II stability/assembly factor-like uncharacterized protein